MIIFTRTACLGGEIIYEKIGDQHEFHNQQKVRADMFLDIINGIYEKPIFSKLDQLLTRRDMGGVYHQSEKLEWITLNKKPQYLIMDNYSELTDKKFVHKDNWIVCGLYGDFNITELEKEFEFYGLLDKDKIYNTYSLFFNYIKNRWDIPIIFLHFPTTFDERIEYIEQGKAITEALHELSKIYDIQNIHADADAIESKHDNDAYHFTTKTFKNMASKIKI